MTSALTHTCEVDFAELTAGDLERWTEQTRAEVAPSLRVVTVQEHGPGGGNPVVRLTCDSYDELYAAMLSWSDNDSEYLLDAYGLAAPSSV